MDVSSFFNRLVQPAKSQGVLRQPDDLDDIDTAWLAVKDTLEHPDERQIVRGIASTDVPRNLQHIVDALVHESTRTGEDETGPCFEYFIREDLLSTLVRLSESDRPHGIKGEVVRSINTLVVLLSDRFLNHNAVHGPLRRLLRSCVGDDPIEGKPEGISRVFGAAGMDRRRQGTSGNEELEADLVDLMCILCSKIRAFPPLLLIFFHDKAPLQLNPQTQLSRTLSPTPSAQTTLTRPSTLHSRSSKGAPNQRFEFLLFSYLLRFVYREGRTGDFARAGLLFLFDIAFLPSYDLGSNARQNEDGLQDAQDALGEFILDGDFAEVMAASIGAVYSLLPSKIRVPDLAEQAGDIVNGESAGMFLKSDKDLEEDMPCTTDSTVQSQLDLLLKLFAFLQDIITRCSSFSPSPSDSDNTTTTNAHLLGAAVSDTTIEAIQSSFLENILYPSILESSSTDGTSVAVMAYLQVILSNVDDGPLLTRLLHFLLDTDSDEAPRLAPHHQPKRFAKGGIPDHPSIPDLGKFTLKDLIIDNLRSKNSSSRSSALNLFQTTLQEHCTASVDGLLSIIRNPPSGTNTHIYPPEISLYSSLLNTLNPSLELFDTSPSFSAYLVDIQTQFQQDRCFRLDQLDETFVSDEKEKMEIARLKRKAVPKHALSSEDPIIREIMLGLEGWMSHTPDENVALARAVVALAGCARRSLEGWMMVGMPEPDKMADPWALSGETEDLDFGYDSDIDNPFLADPTLGSPAYIPSECLPALYQILKSHIVQISTLHQSISSFDNLLSDRRRALLSVGHGDEADHLKNKDDKVAVATPGPPVTPIKKGRPSLARSITGFFSPRKKVAEGADVSDVGVVSPLLQVEEIDEAHDSRSQITKMVSLSKGEVLDGPWAASRTPSRPELDRSASAWSTGTDTGNGLQEESKLDVGSNEKAEKEVSVDLVLDNIVILEEFLKEIVAMIIARRVLRIDPVL